MSSMSISTALHIDVMCHDPLWCRRKSESPSQACTDENSCPQAGRHAAIKCHTTYMMSEAKCDAELELQKDAKDKRERSPWGQENTMLDEEASDFASPAHGDVDMEEGQSPDEGASGYYSTEAHTAYKFEPPRAPAHYGASRNSPSEDPYAHYYSTWGGQAPQTQSWPGADPGTWGYGMSHMGHMPLQHGHSMYDPFGSQASLHPSRTQQLLMENMQSTSHSQSPEDQGTWYDVPFEDGSQPQAAEQDHKAAEQAHARGLAEQAVQSQVAVRDSTTDFDADTAWSDDEGPPPLPAEPAPPLPVSQLQLRMHTLPA